ncbi:hypothetical protein ACTXT7_001596 [Hymenolepis weldensis]
MHRLGCNPELLIGSFMLSMSISFVLPNGCLNYKLLVEHWDWYESLAKPNYIPSPIILAHCSIITYILSLIGWMYYVVENHSKFRFYVPVVYFMALNIAYFMWIFVFFIRKKLDIAAIVSKRIGKFGGREKKTNNFYEAVVANGATFF